MSDRYRKSESLMKRLYSNSLLNANKRIRLFMKMLKHGRLQSLINVYGSWRSCSFDLDIQSGIRCFSPELLSEDDDVSWISFLSSCFSPSLLTMIVHLQRPIYFDDIAMVTLFQDTCFSCLHLIWAYLFLLTLSPLWDYVKWDGVKFRRRGKILGIFGTAWLSLWGSYLRPCRHSSILRFDDRAVYMGPRQNCAHWYQVIWYWK
jgi:hypothetical protein